MPVDEVGRVLPIESIVWLHPSDGVVEEMLSGWRRQQLCRNLAFSTIDGREGLVRRFLDHSQGFPWSWTHQHVEEFFADLRMDASVRHSTVRAYQNALRLFCSYVSDPDYGWDVLCERLFGSHPTQVVFAWNTAPHSQVNEQDPSKRAFTKTELQSFFDRCDDEVDRVRSLGRKGVLPAWRDSVLFKAAYAWGLRRNEVRHLQSVDFSRNPHAREFGRHGVLQVRWGKAHRSSPPKRRSVLTVFDWSVDVVDQWVAEGLPHFGEGLDLFPSGSNGLVDGMASQRFRRYRDDLGLEPGLDMHSLRRSYVTHLIEDGFDPLFVQQQVGHEHASTTAIYTCVSSDFRTRTLRASLDRITATLSTRDDGESR
jgi:site-specific recombinase XerD